MKVVQTFSNRGQDCVLRARAADHICLMRSILFSCFGPFGLDVSPVLRSLKFYFPHRDDPVEYGRYCR